MFRVLVTGEHLVAMPPVRAALARRAGVEIVAGTVGSLARGVDAVVVDQSLDALGVADRLDALVRQHPEACLVVVALQAGDRYRWVRVLPQGSGFAVRGAGTDTLEVILDRLFDDLRADDDRAVHGALATMPRSIA